MERYAILFKTHFWDGFTARQMQRLKVQAGHGHIVAVVDETMQKCGPTEAPQTIRIASEDLAALQLAPVTTHGSVIWYNIDYPHYAAYTQLPEFDYYVCIEYDATVTIPLDSLVASLARERIDYLGFPIRKPCRDWPWHAMHRGIYGVDMLVYLSCFAVFSRRALELLFRRRQEMGRAFAQAELPFWPNNEAFIPNELHNAGMKLASLAAFGDVSAYDWWPPSEEQALAGMLAPGFIHPVLAGERYARSVVYHEPSMLSFFNPASALHYRLRHVSPARKFILLRQECQRRAGAFVQHKLENAGLRRKWYWQAMARAGQGDQAQSVHNRAN